MEEVKKRMDSAVLIFCCRLRSRLCCCCCCILHKIPVISDRKWALSSNGGKKRIFMKSVSVQCSHMEEEGGEEAK